MGSELYDPETYEERLGLDLAFGEFLARAMLGSLRDLGFFAPADLAVEVGAGTGLLSRSLVPSLALRVVASEPDPGMIAEALRRPVDGVSFVRGSVESIPVPPGSADLVVGASVLHHCGDLVAALRGVRRALKPGGYASFVEPARGGSMLSALALLEAVDLAASRGADLGRAPAEARVRVLRLAERAALGGLHPRTRDLEDRLIPSPLNWSVAAESAGFRAVAVSPTVVAAGGEAPSVGLVVRNLASAVGVSPDLPEIAEVVAELDGAPLRAFAGSVVATLAG